MCGVTGFVGAGDRNDLTAMTAALRHRGPDGEGFYVDGAAGLYLGHRRLAILDLAGGAQPMWNENNRIGVVFNGEIYNHAELRVELVRMGHRFASDHADTEVLVHGYEAWGEELPAKLNGMFAFAVLDLDQQRLFLARDRFGEKPLFYICQRGLFAFASELTALCRHSRVEARVDPVALQKFFAYGYVPSPRSIYSGIAKLPPGSCLSYRIDTGAIRSRRYWQYRLHPDPDLDRADPRDLAAELLSLLETAVARRLISDVPLGVFLSGGIDSSAILALATRLRPAQGVMAFTLGFTEPSYDESIPARIMADHCRAEHHLETLDLATALDEIPRILARMDEPLADPSILPTHLVSRFTRRQVTVALSGDGGDELFAGYDPFLALAPARLYDRLVPGGVHRVLRFLAGGMPRSGRNMSLDYRLRRVLTGLSYPEPLWSPVWLGPAEPALLAHLFEDPLPVEELYDEAIALWEDSSAPDLLSRTLEFYANFYLPEDILTKVDRASMMVSLESRAIFLDNDLVDFCLRLPNRYKLRGRSRKVLLKEAVRGLLPRPILERSKKGFGIPLAYWLRVMPMPVEPPPGMRGDRLARMWQAHGQGRADHRQVLWSWLCIDGLRQAG